MLTLCHSSDLTRLADHLLEALHDRPPANPLAPEIMVVHNHGMARWLSVYGAEKEGIVANWKFEFPAERIWELIRLLDKGIPQALPSDCEPMTWSLMHLLQAHSRDPELELLHRYIRDGDPEEHIVRNWKLSRCIANVFDKYLVYRPDLILEWEEGRFTTGDEAERWQAQLWRKLIGYWSDIADDGSHLHRVQLQQELLHAIDREQPDIRDLPERINVFGVYCMPPVYIQILVRLSKLTEVGIYLLDDVYFNSKDALVASMGKEGEDYKHYIEKYIRESPGIRHEVYTYPSGEKPPEDRKLLDHIKRGLVQPESTPGPDPAAADRSVQVHSCHSVVREIEVLYDQLLALLDEDEGLSPDDILIMTPDIETYAPVIDAVFGVAEESLPALPYTISDRRESIHGPVTVAFIKLMKLLESRFKVTDVVDFLGFEPVRDAFGLTGEDLNKLERWIKDNRIRWGIDRQFRQALSLPGTSDFTWTAALDRMMLGYAMKQENDNLFDGILPYEEIEHSDDAELAGSFSGLMRSLFKFHYRIKQTHTLEQWSDLLRNMVDRFLPDTETWFLELSQLRDRFDRLEEHGHLAGFTGILPFRIIRLHLEKKLAEPPENGGPARQGVTFSSLAPMRSIPFRVIGMIGMNDGAFPRPESSVEFDLMNKFPRPGDRSGSKEDRHLFLETILSAGEVIYFSYTGQSNREDAEFSPSVVLQEFLDYIEDRYGIKPDDLTTIHRLQAFSPEYFTESGLEKGLFSYSALQKDIASNLTSHTETSRAFLPSPLSAPGPEWKKLSLGELVRFYQYPSGYLLQNRLGMYLGEEEVFTEDREPFNLGGLDEYLLGQEMLDRYLEGNDPGQFREVAWSMNLLPQGWPGEQTFLAKLEEVRQFGNRLQQVKDEEPPQAVEVDLEIGDYRLTGRLDQVYSSGLTLHRFGRARAKDLVELWIKHLVFQLVKPPNQSGYSRLFTRDDYHQLLPRPDAELKLSGLLEGYEEGLMQPFYFFPDCSFAFAYEVIQRKKDPEKGLKAAAREWKDGYGGYKKEGDKPANRLMFDEADPLETEYFANRTVSFWQPFFEALNGDEE